LVFVLVASTSLLTACVRTGGAPCDEPVAERIDPNSSQHVLPGGPVPAYLTNPPTSGAHRLPPPSEVVLKTELDKPAQVAILEAGAVLIQYDDISDDDTAELAELAIGRGGDVVVAPNDSLPSKIVATAWLYKLECKKLRLADLRSFIDDHAKKEPAH
jgi:hypothetical protein